MAWVCSTALGAPVVPEVMATFHGASPPGERTAGSGAGPGAQIELGVAPAATPFDRRNRVRRAPGVAGQDVGEVHGRVRWPASRPAPPARARAPFPRRCAGAPSAH